MHRILDIYFVGGFGTVQWVDVADYMATRPDSIVAADPQQTISVSVTLEANLHKSGSHAVPHDIAVSLSYVLCPRVWLLV